jgi:glycosyltransferase involved in cell wall biosynthesis
MSTAPRVALVHDWLNGMRGGERVLEALAELFPGAPIFTLFHQSGTLSPQLASRTIVTSFVQRLPGVFRHYRNYLPLFPVAIESFDLTRFDLVISSSHCVAKGAIAPPEAVSVAYLHTPMRYAWDLYHDYFPPERLGWLRRKIVPTAMTALRAWDVSSSARVDRFIANSQLVSRRIGLYYRRDARVIHPPVDFAFYSAVPRQATDYYLIVSALVPYKGIGTALAAFSGLDRPLLVVGEGPEMARLRAVAPPNATFAGHVPREKLRSLYAGARALIFPGKEDFGIVPLEAMAAGCPVIALAAGGALETVVDGETGTFFAQKDPELLREAILRAEGTDLSGEACRERARGFDRPLFLRRLKEGIDQSFEEIRGTRRC